MAAPILAAMLRTASNDFCKKADNPGRGRTIKNKEGGPNMPRTANFDTGPSDDPVQEIAAIFAAGYLRARNNGTSGDLTGSSDEIPANSRPECLDFLDETPLSVIGG